MTNSYKLTAKEAKERMKVKEGLYFLNAGFEKRMSTISQQMRAISLIGVLLDKEDSEIKKEDPIAIIGAGIAGITAAVLAVWRGCKSIHIFEKTSKIADTFEKSQRLIHPRLYEWGVEEDWNFDTAAIPLLDWQTDSGKEVTKIIREQWKYWLDYYGSENSVARRIYLHKDYIFNEKELLNDDIKFKFENIEFKTVILATGFGKRRQPKWISENTTLFEDKNNAYIYDYWAKIPEINESKKIAVFGGNDSALTEAIELSAKIKFEGEYCQLKQDILPMLLKKLESEEKGIREEFNNIKKNYANKITDVQNKDERIELEFETFEAILAIKSDKLKKLIVDNTLKNFHDITLFTRSKNKNGEPYLSQSSFPLNLFLISHFIDEGWVKLVLCENADNVKINESNKYLVPNSDQEFDNALFRLGTEKVESVKKTTKIFIEGLEKQGLQFSSHNISLDIAKKDPDENQEGEWLFTSDLFDSFTQRQVFNELLKTCCSFEQAENELVNLYEKRLYLEILRRGKILFIDTQILDGCFFLRWIINKFSRFTKEEKEFLTKHIIIKMRGDDTNLEGQPLSNTEKASNCLYQFSFYKNKDNNNKNEYKFFRFSYLSDDSANMLDTFDVSIFEKKGLFEEDLEECFKNFPKKLTFEMWKKPSSDETINLKPDEVIHRPTKPFENKKQNLLKEWNKFLQLHDQLYQNKILDDFKIKHFPNNVDSPWDQYSTFEDPALFAMSFDDKESLDAMKYIFMKTENNKSPNRTEVFDFIDSKFLDKSSEKNQMLKNYFSRSYYRAVARQHGANIFETINVSKSCFPENLEKNSIKNLWKYTYRDGDLERKAIVKDLDDNIESVNDLIRIFNEDTFIKSRKNQHQLKVKSAHVEQNSTSNIGQRALALLRGENIKISRLWVEEATKAGAKLPAVVDEENLDQNILNRVEYIYDLPWQK